MNEDADEEFLKGFHDANNDELDRIIPAPNAEPLTVRGDKFCDKEFRLIQQRIKELNNMEQNYRPLLGAA